MIENEMAFEILSIFDRLNRHVLRKIARRHSCIYFRMTDRLRFGSETALLTNVFHYAKWLRYNRQSQGYKYRIETGYATCSPAES